MRIHAEIAALRTNWQNEFEGMRTTVTTLRTDITKVDTYTAGLADSINATQSRAEAAFNLTASAVVEKLRVAAEASDKKLEEIRLMGVNLETMSKTSIQNLEASATEQRTALQTVVGNSETISNELQRQTTAVEELQLEISEAKLNIQKFVTDKEATVKEMIATGEANVAKLISDKHISTSYTRS